MSLSPESLDEPSECPLCLEPLEIDDVHFFPCTCQYQICRFCWHRIRTDENGLCPACRKPYSENPAVYKPLSTEELQRIKSEKKQKQSDRKHKLSENRKHLGSVRVVQKNLVFVVGLSQRLADPEVLKKLEYFGKFGKMHKVVVNSSTSYAGSQGPSASAYITYVRADDALRAIQAVNNVTADGRTLKASLGTTKYCSFFLKGTQCPKGDCMYLHELGDEAASFTKEDMQVGKHQEYEQKLLQELVKGVTPSPHPAAERCNRTRPPVQSRQNNCVSDGNTSGSGSLAYGEKNGLGSIVVMQANGVVHGDFTREALTNGESRPSQSPELPSSELRPPDVCIRPACSHGTRNMTQISSHGPASLPSTCLGNSSVASQSLFSSDGNLFLQRPFPITTVSSLPSSADWLNHALEPPPDSLFSSETMPVDSSTDWQAAFGFGASTQQEDDLGFDPFDVTSKALADLMEKELRVAGQEVLGHFPLRHNGTADCHNGLHTAGSSHVHLHPHFQSTGFAPHLAPGPSRGLATHPWSSSSRIHQPGNLVDLPMTSTQSVLSTGVRSTGSTPEPVSQKMWQDSLRALLPNVNINFGAPAASCSLPSHLSSPCGKTPVGWPRDSGWMDPAIITGIPAQQTESCPEESPPHWLKSLQTLTEGESPLSPSHTTPPTSSSPFTLHRPAAWSSTLLPFSGLATATTTQVPPPGFQPTLLSASKERPDFITNH
uniref:CCR4-NOT transcription complex subunit 4 n=1 Tax=Myxine glutinosa TaxID=7769 RepID=UPI00358DF5BA